MESEKFEVQPVYYRLVTKTHRTGEIGSGLWPTPRATEVNASKNAKGCRGMNIINPDGREWGINLRTALIMWPQHLGIKKELRLHPNFVEEMMGFPIHWTDPETKH